ncbi:MAG: radical SAM protein [Candidatus Hodarchaeota archaeon]
MVVDRETLEFIHLSDGTKSFRQIVKLLAREKDTSARLLLRNTRLVLKELKKAHLVGQRQIVPSLALVDPILENITLNATRKCNLKCIHCFLDDSISVPESLSISNLKRFLKEGQQYLSPNLNFVILGGEPLLNKAKTLEIAELGKNRRCEVIVSTNGILVDSAFARKASEMDLVVQVSMEGSIPELNDEIRGANSFSKAKKGVKLLVEHNVYTILCQVVQKANFHDIESFYNFAVALGVNEVRFIPLKLMGRARSLEFGPVAQKDLLHAIHRILMRYPEAKNYLKRDFLAIMRTICARSNKRAYCGTGLKTILIDADGEVYPCPNHAVQEFRCGNISETNFRDIWLKAPILRRIREAYHIDTINQECPICPVKYWCMGGCRGETYENTGTLNSKATNCEDIKRAIIEMFWILSTGEFRLLSERTEFF